MDFLFLIPIVINILSIVIAFTLFIAISLAAIGKSLGIRKRYVDILLHLFEFGRQRIQSYEVKHQLLNSHKPDGSISKFEQDDSFEDHMAGDGNEKNNYENIINGIDDLIKRDISISAVNGIELPLKSSEDLQSPREFQVGDVMYFMKCGMESIIQDDVTQRFSAEELKSWNLLTRTDKGYQFISVRLTILWCLGTIFRYSMLLPVRLMLCSYGLSWMILSTFLIGYIKEGKAKKTLNRISSLMAHQILCRAMSSLVRFHNAQYRPSKGICVANHTSPLDVVILSSDNCYAMVGQSHSGFLGIMQRALSRATYHIWFERSEIKDRLVVSQRMKDHINHEDKLPVLIFPEGTCINNTSVMMFKKGGFEVTPIVYPVAVKYDSRFGDAFWNSSKDSMVRHIFNIMTSWALVVDIWYLPPMIKKDGEDSVDFANRVKAEIAKQGGLVDLEWDGQLKRMKAKDTWKCKPQHEYSKLLKTE